MEHIEIVKNCWNSFSGELGTGKVGPVLWDNGVMTTGVVFLDNMYTVGVLEQEELVGGSEEAAHEELARVSVEEADEELVLVEQSVDETG